MTDKNKTPKELFEAFLGSLVLFIAQMPYGTLAWGFVAFKFWMWFIKPIFAGLPILTFVQAVGLMMFIGLFRSSQPFIKKEYLDGLDKTAVYIRPVIVFIFGFIVKTIIQ